MEVASAGMLIVAMTGVGRGLPSGVAGSLAREFPLFLFFLASEEARAGPLVRATRAAVVVFGRVTLGSFSCGVIFGCGSMELVWEGGVGVLGLSLVLSIRDTCPCVSGC